MKCLGGRELRGALRGYDELVNLVLDDCEEFLRGMSLWCDNQNFTHTVLCHDCAYIRIFDWLRLNYYQ